MSEHHPSPRPVTAASLTGANARVRDAEFGRIAALASAIERARTVRSLTRTQLAHLLGTAVLELVTEEAVAAWEQGRALPRATWLPPLEAILDLPEGFFARVIWPDGTFRTPATPPAAADELTSSIAALGTRDRRLVQRLVERLAEAGESAAARPESSTPTTDSPAPVPARQRAKPKRNPLLVGKRDHHLDRDAIRRFRLEVSLTSEQLADRLGVPEQMILDIESGARPAVQMQLWHELAKALSVPLPWITAAPDYSDVPTGASVNSVFLVHVVRMHGPDRIAEDEDRGVRVGALPWKLDDLLAVAGVPRADFEAVEQGGACFTLLGGTLLGKVVRVDWRAFINPADSVWWQQ